MLSCLLAAFFAPAAALPGAAPADPASVVSLDGDAWLLAPDPRNAGRAEEWYRAARPDAARTEVPWIIQDAFPGCHGVAWCWRTFTAPRNERPEGRTLLRFWAVDYTAEVWLNGTRLGAHEGGEAPFLLDATEALTPGEENLLAVRVLNPTHEPIDGIVLGATPHRNKALPYSPGSAWNQGGIIDSVELVLAPAVRIDDVFAHGDRTTGTVRLETRVVNATSSSKPCFFTYAIAPAQGGETSARAHEARLLPPGETIVPMELTVPAPRPWQLNDPALYRVTARVVSDAIPAADERSARIGFRDFRFERGAFRLNGTRLYLKCSHTGNCCPIGLELPHDPDLLRRDLLNAKTMGFNAIRFIAGVAKRYQLDLCDEIGLMVYEEAYASWCMGDSPALARRYSDSILGMVLRDRNHPSIVMWGLLNETPEGAVFRQAVGLLPALRKLDDSRMVMLNSGRWDAHGGSAAGIEIRRMSARTDPCITRNGTERVIKALGITWAPGQLASHPGVNGEYSVLRWTAPAAGDVDIDAEFASIAERATTDVHVLRNREPLFNGLINIGDGGPRARFRGSCAVRAGDTLDFAVGFGNGDYGADTTALAVRITAAGGATHDAAADFDVTRNPCGPWSYGMCAPGATVDPATFAPYTGGSVEKNIGTLSNPGSAEWEDVLSDQHPYQRVPHTAGIIAALRTLNGGHVPVFISEYGIGSAVDLVRAVRHYERLGKTAVEDAAFYRAQLDRFMADYAGWNLAEVFPRPDDFFAQSNARMAAQRLLGLNAIRSNPGVIGYSLTGTVDQGMTGEGLWTTFREFKPGTFDAVADGFAPLRICLFAEPVNVYAGARVRLEAVLANEDSLAPGEYKVRLLLAGPAGARIFERTAAVTIPEKGEGAEPPMVLPFFAEEVVVRGAPGRYRFLASFENGAAAAGGEAELYLDDAAAMPPVPAEVVLLGDDAGLAEFLAGRKIAVRLFAKSDGARRETILVAGAAAPPQADLIELARRVARGAGAVFLTPSVLATKDDPVGRLPLARKGALAGLPSWLYHKDEWAKAHPIFEGLPAGGLMDYTYYRELIPDAAFVDIEPPEEAVAGAINAAIGYSSGLFTAVYGFGAGTFVINALAVRENLGTHPAAERLLRNMLRYAARDTQAPPAGLPADFQQHLEAIGYAVPRL